MIKRHVAPDGGYGWVVVFSTAFSNMMVIPILQGFGLIFRDVFKQLNFTATDISTIINVNSAFGMILGIWNGPLLKRFGYRKMALAGGLMSFVGFVLTSRANSFMQFVLYYGTFPSYGFVLIMASSSLALNTYFLKKRSFASGICMTLTGLGPIIMPLVISKLLEVYDVRGAALIIAGLSLHSVVAAMLLHPVQRHAVHQEPEMASTEGEEKALTEGEEMASGQEKTLADLPMELVQSVQDLEAALQPRRISESVSVRGLQLHESPDEMKEKMELDSTWWKNSAATLPRSTSFTHIETEKNRLSRASEEVGKKERRKWYSGLVEFFDLDLLKDPIYFNIWLGLSLAFTAEINFSLMTPIILGDRHFDIQDTARLMSVLAFTDIVFRFIAPFCGRFTGLTARNMYMVSLAMLVASRTLMTFFFSYKETVVVFALLGMAKGFRSVYMTLVIPNHVPLEKLPSASSLQTVLNGVFSSLFGPLLGYLRDISGNYNICIHMINMFTMTTLLLWTIEIVVLARKRRKEKRQGTPS